MKIKIGKFERPSLAQGEHGYAKLYANGEKVGWIERWMKRDFVYGYTGAWAVESYFAMVRRGTEWTHLSESVRGPLGQKLQSAAEAKRAFRQVQLLSTQAEAASTNKSEKHTACVDAELIKDVTLELRRRLHPL